MNRKWYYLFFIPPINLLLPKFGCSKKKAWDQNRLGTYTYSWILNLFFFEMDLADVEDLVFSQASVFAEG
jgi:hypothetical protein